MTNSASFSNPLQEDIRSVERLILSQADGYHKDLHAALELLLSAGGKRVRPTLTFLVGKMLGAPHDLLVTLGASIEMLHTATLVHDDLIDGSLLRRGSPTLNSQWTPGATVLTGDFLFACAARLAAESNSIPLMKLFAKTLTVIVNGEINQLFENRCRINRDSYYRRIYAKTASLFETTAATAAMISPVAEDIIEDMRRFGYEIGMAFQIMDDVLDFTSEQATLGKPVGNDLRQGLITLPTIYYCETHANDTDVKKLNSETWSIDEQVTNHLVESVRRSDAIQLSIHEAKQSVDRSLSYLEKQPGGQYRQALEDLANYIVQRNN